MKCQARWITSWNIDYQERYQWPQRCRWCHSNGRKWGGTKKPLDGHERGKWKSWLETQHSKNLRSWQPVPSLHGKWKGEVKAVIDFIILGSKITADGDWSHKIKRCLLLGKKAMTNLDRVLKSRDTTLLTKICIVKAMVFPVVHIQLWELGHKGGWAPKNWYFQIGGAKEDSWGSLGLQDYTSQS